MFMAVDLPERLIQIWHELPRRPGTSLPVWQDVKATHIAPIMNYSWVLEYQGPGVLIVKFFGSQLVPIDGRDTTGSNFLERRIPPNWRGRMVRLYQNVQDARCAAQVRRTILLDEGLSKEMRTTFVPLANDTPGRWCLLGCTELSRARAVDDREVADRSINLADHEALTHMLPDFFDLGHGVPSWPASLEEWLTED